MVKIKKHNKRGRFASRSLRLYDAESKRNLVKRQKSEVDKKDPLHASKKKLTAFEIEKESLQNQEEEDQSMVPLIDGTEKKRKVN